jgi:hypothetical protein
MKCSPTDLVYIGVINHTQRSEVLWPLSALTIHNSHPSNWIRLRDYGVEYSRKGKDVVQATNNQGEVVGRR